MFCIFFLAQLCIALKLGRFGKKIRNTWKALKCGAGEGWRILFGLNVQKIKKYYTVKEETIKRRKANWIGHILRRNCLLKHVIEETIGERTEVTGELGRIHMELLDNLKEKREYCKLKEEALDRTL
jgi:hypothetical protein